MDVQRLWRIPALAIAANVVLLLWLFSSLRIGTNWHLYEVMFYATPVIGMVVLCWVVWLKLSRPPHLRIRRAVWWSVLAVTEPVWLFVLQVVLSGFAR